MATAAVEKIVNSNINMDIESTGDFERKKVHNSDAPYTSPRY